MTRAVIKDFCMTFAPLLIVTTILGLVVGGGISTLVVQAQPVLSGQIWEQYPIFVPTTPTDLSIVTSHLVALYFANTGGSSVTCNLVDRSTHCSSGACTIWPDVSIAAKSVYAADMHSLLVPAGFRWSCSAATVVGYVAWRQ